MNLLAYKTIATIKHLHEVDGYDMLTLRTFIDTLRNKSIYPEGSKFYVLDTESPNRRSQFYVIVGSDEWESIIQTCEAYRDMTLL